MNSHYLSSNKLTSFAYIIKMHENSICKFICITDWTVPCTCTCISCKCEIAYIFMMHSVLHVFAKFICLIWIISYVYITLHICTISSCMNKWSKCISLSKYFINIYYWFVSKQELLQWHFWCLSNMPINELFGSQGLTRKSLGLHVKSFIAKRVKHHFWYF